MRVLFFANLVGYSHDKKWILYLSKQKNIECFVVSIGENFQQLTDGEILELRSLNVTVLNPIRNFSIRNFRKTISDLLYIRTIVKQKQIDLIHVIYIDPNALWAIFKILFRIPIILSTLGSDVNIGLNLVLKRRGFINRILFFLYKKAFLNADIVTCASQDQIDKLKSGFELNKEIYFLRTGSIPFNQFIKSDSEILNKLTKGKYVFFPRSQRPVYNHEFAIDAINKLSDQVLKEYSFVFLNRDSSDQSYVSKIASLMEESKKNIRWTFLNSITSSEMSTLYKNSSLVVMTPLSDGSPVSAMEAMMLKIPLILPPLNYDQELFKDTTFTLRNWDSTELAGLMTTLLTDREFAMTYVESAYTTVMEKANFFKEMEKVITFYDSLIRGNS